MGFLGVRDLQRAVRLVALVHSALHLLFLGLEAYSLHWYGLMGEVLCLAGCVLLFQGARQQNPTLYIPYLLSSSVYIAAWLGAGLWVLLQGLDEDRHRVHTLLRWQPRGVAVAFGVTEMLLSVAQLLPLKLVYDAFVELRTLAKLPPHDHHNHGSYRQDRPANVGQV